MVDPDLTNRGRPELSTPGTRSSGDNVAVQDKPNIKTIEIDNTDTLPSGANENTYIYAPEGAVYRVVAMSYDVDEPANSSSGTHFMYLTSGESVLVTRGEASYNLRLRFSRHFWKNADNQVDPTNEAAQASAVQSCVADSEAGLRFSYYNQTDVDQTNSRSIRLVVEERRF